MIRSISTLVSGLHAVDLCVLAYWLPTLPVVAGGEAVRPPERPQRGEGERIPDRRVRVGGHCDVDAPEVLQLRRPPHLGGQGQDHRAG